MTNKGSTLVTRELTSKFNEFNHISEKLIASYQNLERTISRFEENQDLGLRGKTLNSAPLLDSLPAAVVILDESGFVRECNLAAVKLLEIDLISQNWRKVINTVFDPRLDDGHDISLKNGRRVNISTNPTPFGKGQILLIKDVTENRRLQDQLSHFQRLSSMGEMAATLAHQIRTPLSSILLYLAQLKQPSLDFNKRLNIIETLITLVRSSENLINDLLVFSKKDLAGSEEIDLDSLLSQLCSSVKPKMKKLGIKLDVENKLQEIVFYFHRELLLSAMQNLIQNSMEAIEKNGQIRIVVEKNMEGFFDLMIHDNGRGFNNDIHDKICEPFFTTRQQGTGLGLAMVEAIARANNSSLWFESRKDQGATFALRIPYRNKEGLLHE